MNRASPRVGAGAAALGMAVFGMFSGCECVAGLNDDVRLDPAGAGGGATSSTSPNGSGGGTSAGSGGDDTGSVGGSGGAGQGGTGGAAIDCSVVGYPLPPPGDDSGGDVTFVVAVRSVILDEEDGVSPPGLNLDRTCTCPGPSSCVSEDADPDTLCDRDGSLDVQSERIFGQIALLTNDAFSSRELSQDAEIGRWSLLMRIEGWTGEPDDPRVTFSTFPSPGFAAEDVSQPAWNGDDEWFVDASSVGPSGQLADARFVDEAAYVVGNQLVASLPESGITLSPEDSVLALKLSGAFLVATIVEEGASYGLRSGVLAAVWPTEGIFESLDGFRDGNGDPLCTDDALFNVARDTVCETADIFDGVATPTSPCNGVSVGIGFSADPAVLGEVVDSPVPSPGCDPERLPSTCKCDDEC